VRWSDGSLQLLIGNEVLDISVQDAQHDQAHLFLRHGKVTLFPYEMSDIFIYLFIYFSKSCVIHEYSIFNHFDFFCFLIKSSKLFNVFKRTISKQSIKMHPISFTLHSFFIACLAE
jgi:hypothetical protein